MPKLPQEVYVFYNEDDSDKFLLANEEIEDAAESAGEKVEIGTYVLQHKAKYSLDRVINEL